MSKTVRSITRRDALTAAAVCILPMPVLGCTRDEEGAAYDGDPVPHAPATDDESNPRDGEAMRIHYLEIVTKDVDAACKLHSEIHGVTFGDPDQSLGGARTAELANGGMLGIRAPMHDGEKSVTRAYTLVNDIEAAVAAAKESGAEIAVPPMKIAGHGTCAVYFHGGIEAGFWQV